MLVRSHSLTAVCHLLALWHSSWSNTTSLWRHHDVCSHCDWLLWLPASIAHYLSLALQRQMRRCDSTSTNDVLHWNVHVKLLHEPCPPEHNHRWPSPSTSPSCLFCNYTDNDNDESMMCGMVTVTLQRAGEALFVPPSDVWRHIISLTMPTFPMSQIDRGYLLPTRWTYVMNGYGVSGSVRRSASGGHANPVGLCTRVPWTHQKWG